LKCEEAGKKSKGGEVHRWVKAQKIRLEEMERRVRGEKSGPSKAKKKGG